MPLILGAQSAIGAADVVTNSCRFNDGDAVQLYRAVSVEGNRKVWTISFWIKIGNAVGCRLFAQGATPSQDPSTMFELGASGAMTIFDYRSSTYNFILEPSAKLKDPNAWYHLVMSFDSTPATPSSTSIKFFINGTQQTAFSTETYPAQDFETEINNTTYDFYAAAYDGGNYFDGYMAEFCLIDGTAYDASDFGEFNADSPTIWQPKDVSELTFGTNGFYLDFEDSSALGTDAAGSNNLTATNLVAVDQGTDTPVNNFATLNPLTVDTGGAKTYSEGNTTVAETANSWTSAHSSLAVAAGKWYFESKFNLTASTEGYFGCASVPEINARSATTFYLGQGASIGYYTTDGDMTKGGASTSYGNAVTTGQIISVALDITNELAYFAINGTWQNSADPVAGSGGVAFPSGMTDGEFICLSVSPNESYWECNFGGSSGFTVSSGNADGNGYGNFEYAPPTGYLALCTKNIGSDGG